MSEMVERVAKAIRDKAIERGYSINPLARHLAVAAIEALCEPTDADLNGKFGVSSRDLFTEMLDELLK